VVRAQVIRPADEQSFRVCHSEQPTSTPSQLHWKETNAGLLRYQSEAPVPKYILSPVEGPPDALAYRHSFLGANARNPLFVP